MKTRHDSGTNLSNRTRSGSSRRLVLLALAIGLLVLAVFVTRLWVNPGSIANPAEVQTLSPTAPVPTDPAPMELSPVLGPPDAPVTIIEYGDFGCPSCWYWHKRGVLGQLRAKYGDQIRFVWRDFPVITLRSPAAAEAGQCAHEQGKFWEFHDLIYEHQGAIEDSDLKADAAEIGLDMAKFNECVTSHRYQERVNAEQHEGFEHGFNGTPAFLINDQRLVGPADLATFEKLIDPLLASKQ